MKERPIRIQRKRTKGWKMPANTVYVGRGSAWGNPYKISPLTTREMAVNGYRHDCNNFIAQSKIKRELRGKNLACWCRIDQPCHADVLLEIANG